MDLSRWSIVVGPFIDRVSTDYCSYISYFYFFMRSIFLKFFFSGVSREIECLGNQTWLLPKIILSISRILIKKFFAALEFLQTFFRVIEIFSCIFFELAVKFFQEYLMLKLYFRGNFQNIGGTDLHCDKPIVRQTNLFGLWRQIISRLLNPLHR